MKLKKWLFGAATLAMLAACSENDLANGSGENSEDLGDPVSGYLAVEIKLPQQAASRALNDVYDDGTANEYEVENAMIVIFNGKDEMSAKFHKAQDLKRPFLNNMPSNDNITTSYMAAVQVSKTTNSSDHFWGLVILNRNEKSTAVTEPDANGNPTVKIGGALITTQSTFSDVLNEITANSFLETAGTTSDTKTYSKFFMTNAPLSKVQGGGSGNASALGATGNIQYLADLGNETYSTIEEAREHVNNCIYVERAVAKVTCSVSPSPYNLTFYGEDGEEVKGLTVNATVKYALTNTNQKSYVVRNVNFPTDNEKQHFSWAFKTDKNNSGFRMVGETSMPKLNSPYHDEEQSLYRTYWCLDPNYGDIMGDDDKHVVTSVDEFTSISKPLYCKENTFTVANQNYGNTTLAMFQVTYSVTTADKKTYGDGNLYTKGSDTSKVFASAESVAYQEISRIKNSPQILEALEEAAKASGQTSIKDATKYLDIKTAVEDGYLILTSISLKAAEGAFTAAGVAKFNEILGSASDSSSLQSQILGSVNAINDIVCYEGGVSYYVAPIKHFGDEYCPWPAETIGTSTEAVYNNNKPFTTTDDTLHASRYLGRYGVVRNNWYDLVINDVKSLGSPTLPEIDLTLSDDNNEEKSYIGVEIHILSWAKRTQSVIF